MAMSATSPGFDPVRQFSVFVENRVGRLFDLIALYRRHEVHVLAITVLDSTDSALVRLVVDDPDQARELLVNNDFAYTEGTILAVEIADEAALKDVLAAILEAEINVNYVYSFIQRPGNRHALAIQTEDTEVAAQNLANRGFRVLQQTDLSR